MHPMIVVCMDLEGVLGPEMWPNLAKATGIKKLERTTATEPDYYKLMHWRLNILQEHGLTIHDIQKVMSELGPLEGARKFVDAVRKNHEFVVMTDSFYEYQRPIVEQLGRPTLFANNLDINGDGVITNFDFRTPDPKRKTVQSLQNMNFKVVGIGDSYNDITMIESADKGILFKGSPHTKKDYPKLETAETYDELLKLIEQYAVSVEE